MASSVWLNDLVPDIKIMICLYLWGFVWVTKTLFVNEPISQIPQCIRQISYNAPICNSAWVGGGGWGVGDFLRWWPPSATWASPLICYGRNNAIFFNLGLFAACCAHFMCHHKLWPISVSHPFSFLNSSLGLAGRKLYQKITIHIFRLQNFAIPCYFPHIIFCRYLFSLLSSGWFVIAVCGSVSVRELLKS